MDEPWYELVQSGAPLTQGDLVPSCPLLEWKAGPIKLEGSDEAEQLTGFTDAVSADVVVMTQSCDLEQKRVQNVILCPHLSLSEHRLSWKEQQEQLGQNPTAKAWARHCDQICNGFIWTIAMLNESRIQDLRIDRRVVYFHEVYTVPISFLASLLEKRKHPRFRLLPPYREHLSQAFARFFMRVGLPTPINRNWGNEGTFVKH